MTTLPACCSVISQPQKDKYRSTSVWPQRPTRYETLAALNNPSVATIKLARSWEEVLMVGGARRMSD